MMGYTDRHSSGWTLWFVEWPFNFNSLVHHTSDQRITYNRNLHEKQEIHCQHIVITNNSQKAQVKNKISRELWSYIMLCNMYTLFMPCIMYIFFYQLYQWTSLQSLTYTLMCQNTCGRTHYKHFHFVQCIHWKKWTDLHIQQWPQKALAQNTHLNMKCHQ